MAQMDTRIDVSLPGDLVKKAAVRGLCSPGDSQGSGVFLTYPVLCGMRRQGGFARVVGTGMPT